VICSPPASVAVNFPPAAATASTAQLRAERGHLLARDPLELGAEDLGDAEVVLDQREVHRRLVLAEHDDLELILGQEQRGAEATWSIADHDHVRHAFLRPEAWHAGGAETASRSVSARLPWCTDSRRPLPRRCGSGVRR
jgi:hypothetical protein